MGINDIDNTQASGTTAWNNKQGYIETAIADGWLVIGITCTPVTVAWNKNSDAINDFNTLLKAYSNPLFEYVDINTHAELSDPTNGTYFFDGLHLTSAGYSLVSNDIAAKINAL